MGKFWSKQEANYKLGNGEVAAALYRSILVIDDSQDSSESILEGIRSGVLIELTDIASDNSEKIEHTGDIVNGVTDVPGDGKLPEGAISGTQSQKIDPKKASRKDSSGKSTRNR